MNILYTLMQRLSILLLLHNSLELKMGKQSAAVVKIIFALVNQKKKKSLVWMGKLCVPWHELVWTDLLHISWSSLVEMDLDGYIIQLALGGLAWLDPCGQKL